jgi:hypothetical protein
MVTTEDHKLCVIRDNYDDVCIYVAMSWSLVQAVLPTVLDKETEVKRKVSWMPHAPVRAKKE